MQKYNFKSYFCICQKKENFDTFFDPPKIKREGC